MKSTLIACLLSLVLVACQPTSSNLAASAVQAQPSQVQPSPYSTLALTTDQVRPVQLDYTPRQNSSIYYFTPDGQLSHVAVSHGFYRKILGETADGRVVAQDYYADAKKPQTAPFVIKKGGDPRSFNRDILDSRVIWYDHQDGDIISVGVFHNGVQQGWLDVYEYKKLVVQLKDVQTGIAMRFFSPDDKIWGEAQIGQGEKGLNIDNLTFYHPNGQIMSKMDVDANGKPSGMTTYDEQGHILDDSQNIQYNQTLLRRFAVIVHKLSSLMAR